MTQCLHFILSLLLFSQLEARIICCVPFIPGSRNFRLWSFNPNVTAEVKFPTLEVGEDSPVLGNMFKTTKALSPVQSNVECWITVECCKNIIHLGLCFYIQLWADHLGAQSWHYWKQVITCSPALLSLWFPNLRSLQQLQLLTATTSSCCTVPTCPRLHSTSFSVQKGC